MESDEKKALEKVNHVDQEKSTSSINQDYFDEALNEPEESLQRGLKARQISMIAVSVCFFQCHSFTHNHVKLGGAVGTGLIIGSGTALRRGGPLGAFCVVNDRASRFKLQKESFWGILLLDLFATSSWSRLGRWPPSCLTRKDLLAMQHDLSTRLSDLP